MVISGLYVTSTSACPPTRNNTINDAIISHIRRYWSTRWSHCKTSPGKWPRYSRTGSRYLISSCSIPQSPRRYPLQRHLRRCCRIESCKHWLHRRFHEPLPHLGRPILISVLMAFVSFVFIATRIVYLTLKATIISFVAVITVGIHVLENRIALARVRDLRFLALPDFLCLWI